MSTLSVAVVFGTRPEAIKLLPVVRELRRRPECFTTHVLATAQHRVLLDMVIDDFGIVPDVDLDLMQPDQGPAELASAALERLDALLSSIRPQWVIVQGDTTTTLAAALAAFWQGVNVCHVEAGLRSGCRESPFPEEMHRRLVTQIAALHCAPTLRARDALLAERVEAHRIIVTGNTVVDALHWVLDHPAERYDDPVVDRRAALVLVTVHRRENFGRPLLQIIEAVRTIVAARPEVHIVWPVHPNPRIHSIVRQQLTGRHRITLTDPLPYRRFVRLLERSSLVLTDSGGVQEEMAVLGRSALVLRENTERPEALNGGAVVLVPAQSDRITAAAIRALTNGARKVHCPSAAFGDGRAARHIVDALLQASNRLPRRSREFVRVP